MFTLEQRKILPYAIIVFLGYVGFGIPLPLFPEMFLEPDRSILPASYSLEEKTFLLGLLFACYPFGQLLGSPILGSLSDKLGRKKTILISLFVCFLSYMGVAYAISVSSLSGLFLGLFIAGFSEGNVAIAKSVIVDIAAAENKAKHFGFIEIFGTSAFIVGPLLGGLLADPKKVSWFTFSTPFWIASIMTAVGFLIIMFACKETRLKGEEEHPPFWGEVKSLFSDRELRLYYIANFFVALGFFSFFRFLPVYLDLVFHLSTSTLGYIIAYDATWIAIALAFVIPRFANRIVPRKATAYASFFYALFLVMLLIPQNPWALAITIPPLGICFAFSLTYGALLISDTARYTVHGQAMGCLISMQVLAATITAIVGGYLAAIGASLPLIAGAVMSVICGLMLYRHPKYK